MDSFSCVAQCFIQGTWVVGIRGWLAFPGQAGVFKEGWEREFPLYPGRVQQEADGEGVQETGTQALPEGLQLPSMDDLQSTTVTTLKWCSKAARAEFARELASVLNRIKAQPGQ